MKRIVAFAIVLCTCIAIGLNLRGKPNQTQGNRFHISAVPSSIGFGEQIKIEVTNLSGQPQFCTLALYVDDGKGFIDLTKDALAKSWNEVRNATIIPAHGTKSFSWRPQDNDGTNYLILMKGAYKLRAHGEGDDAFSNAFAIRRNPIELVDCHPRKRSRHSIVVNLDNATLDAKTVHFQLQSLRNGQFADAAPCKIVDGGKRFSSLDLKGPDSPRLVLVAPIARRTGHQYRVAMISEEPPIYESYSAPF
ncbi:MAG TPA: hypothetical protein VGL56_11905 [Fimbriimonadaceae bacterium]|jgi:hypothetical protein